MSRGIHANMEAAISADAVKPFFLVDLMFTSPVYLWSGGYTLSHSSNSYLGSGDLLTVEVPEESQDLGAVGVKLTLSGLTGTNILSAALQQEYQGKSVVIKLGAFDSSGNIVTNPVVIFEGFMDIMQIVEDGDSSTITLNVENKLIRLETANHRRYTDSDQRIDHAGDRGFEFITDIQEKQIKWGQ